MGQKLVRMGARGQGSRRPALTQGLEVESHQLAAHVPEELGHVVGRVHAGALGVDAAELLLVVSKVGSQGPRRALTRSCPKPRAAGPASASRNPPPGLGSPPWAPTSWPSPCAFTRPLQNPDGVLEHQSPVRVA